jgi:L-threonylcarbamoyladenylate synthase
MHPSDIPTCVAALRGGAVIAYPTEAVYGLGCDPLNESAVARLFALKQRPRDQGVLLIAAEFDQLKQFIGDVPADAIARARATWPGPHTWVFPRSAATPAWLAGGHTGIAVRITAHAPASQLCRAFGAALVSTSANPHGTAPARSAAEVHAMFGNELAYILEGTVGGLERPTPISDAMSGNAIRV